MRGIILESKLTIFNLRSGTSSLSYSSGGPTGPLENELDVLCDRADATLDPIWHLNKINK